MKNLLSHAKTKMELADYLAQKTIEVGVHNQRRVVVAWRSECTGTRGVLVLVLRRYSSLFKDTLFITGRGRNHREIQLHPIYRALGSERAPALPAFHALSGADNAGCFFCKKENNMLESFHGSWRWNHRRSFSARGKSNDSHWRHSGSDREVGVPALPNRDVFSEWTEMVTISKETSLIRKASPNPGNSATSHLESPSSGSSLE